MKNKEPDYKQFGKTIRALRGNKLSQQTVSEALDISATYYSNIENGLAHPSLGLLVSIANYYNISLAEAFEPGRYRYDIPEDVREAFSKCPKDKLFELFDVLQYTQDKLF